MIRHLNTPAFTDSPSISWDWRLTNPQASQVSLGLRPSTNHDLPGSNYSKILKGRSLTRLCNIEKTVRGCSKRMGNEMNERNE